LSSGAKQATVQPEHKERESPVGQRAAGSLFRKAGARLAGDVFVLFLATVVGIVTARFLGPSGKGILATLAFLGLIAASLAGAGLGEAAVVRVGQGAIELKDAIAATVAGVAATSCFAGACLFAAGAVLFAHDWSEARWPLIIVAGSVPVVAYFDALQQLLNAREHIVTTSVLAAGSALIAAIATVVFLGPLHWGLIGAVVAVATGAVVGTLGCMIALARMGHRPLPRWDRTHLRWALGYGTKVQSAYLAGTLAARFDLLLVFSIAGSRQAGYYSVALTVGFIVVTIPWAVSASTFPRLASVDSHEARRLTVTVCRLGFLAAISSAVVLALTTPFILPVLYGRAFTPAVVPSIILLFGGLFASLQTLLCRAVSARGDPWVLLMSSITALVIMVAADTVVIGPFGILGAATVASLSAGLALVVALRALSKRSIEAPGFLELLPRGADVRVAIRLLSRLVSRARLPMSA
jgi:O-antigen/teichoic acid export membrane protein